MSEPEKAPEQNRTPCACRMSARIKIPPLVAKSLLAELHRDALWQFTQDIEHVLVTPKRARETYLAIEAFERRHADRRKKTSYLYVKRQIRALEGFLLDVRAHNAVCEIEAKEAEERQADEETKA